MKITSEMKKAAAKEDARVRAKYEEGVKDLPLTEGQVNWLVTKEFKPEFLAKITRGMFNKRVYCINVGREKIYNLLSNVPGLQAGETEFGTKYIEATVSTETRRFYFGKDSITGENKEDLANLIEYIDNDGITAVYQEYLSNFWPKKSTFMRIFGVCATAIPDGMTVEEAIEWDRFNTTMAEYRRRQKMMYEDNKFLYSIIRDMTKEQAWAEALGQEPMDRSREAEAMKKVFANLDHEQQIDLAISRKVVQVLRNVNPYGDFNDLYWDDRQRHEPHIMTPEEMRCCIMSAKGMEYKTIDKNGNEVTKKITDWNLFFRFLDFYKDKEIDLDGLLYITGSNKWSWGKFCEKTGLMPR